MSLEEEINYLTAAVHSLEVVVAGLTLAMQTLTATARTEIEVKHGKPMIEVISKDDERYDSMMKTWGPRAKEQFPRAICKASCCGALHRRSRNGSCAECRGKNE